MNLNLVSNPEHLTVQTTNRRTPSLPAVTSSVFSHAKHTRIQDSSFIITNNNINPGPVASLDILYKRVAPHAILNAGGRADEVRCHPGTRKEVIGRIEKWMTDAQDGKMGSRIFWLSGPAGAGKSAILQTVAESWSSRGIHAANFFFFRGDASRNHARAFVPTLLYQIFDFYPALREAAEKVLASKPRILEASIRQQFDELICSPLRSIVQLFSQPLILLVDGLDECDSQEKTSQQQILQALDMLAGQNDLPLLVLVASRVEHQIAMAFRQLSSAVDSTFLSEDYSSQKDIRLFVTAEFARIKRTHPLAPSDANWPSASDVNDIVAKSSGQFIYAATVMRFILDSPAAPMLSLQKVQGVARFGGKSPFSQLDTLYTYIFAQADDQETLKDILHAALFVSDVSTSDLSQRITLEKCLRIQDERYNHYMIESCIADVAAVARFEDDELIFYHASLPDYLKDQARSGAYFFDGNAFDLKIVPLLFNHQFQRIAYRCLSRLKILTLEIMRAFNAQDGDSFIGIREMPEDPLIPLHDLCVRHDVVTEYRLFLYKWVTDRMYINASQNIQPRRSIPYIHRYVTMVQIDNLNGDIWRNSEVVVDILSPKSASDGNEIAMWLRQLYLRIYAHYYPDELGVYKQLLRRWTSWSVSNNVPFTNLDKTPALKHWYHRGIKPQDIPYGNLYITMAQIEHINGDVTQDPNVVVNILRAGSTTDAEEITLWVQSLLQRIQRAFYPHRLEKYKKLIRQWISWAEANEIPLSSLRQRSSNHGRSSFKLEDMPFVRIYITMNQINLLCGDIWQNSDIVIDALRQVSELDVEEVALWIQNLLRSINAKFYLKHLEKYKRLIRQWISWANSNNIPLCALRQSINDGLPSFKLEDIPYSQMYIAMTQIDLLCGDIWQNPDIAIDALRPESASDVDEVASWIHTLLRSIQAKFYSKRLITYKRLIRRWIIWAASNHIPLCALQQSPSDNLPSFKLEDIPYGRMYLTMAQIDSLCGDIWQDFDMEDNVLHPKSASETEEVALWMQNLLQSIYAKFYPDRRIKYKQLMKEWIMWALSHDVPLLGLVNLPDARQCLIEVTLKKWIAGSVKNLLLK